MLIRKMEPPGMASESVEAALLLSRAVGLSRLERQIFFEVCRNKS